MSVRVIAGSAKGRRLKVPSMPGLRPTGDRARETLFSVLAPRLPNAVFLDAFAGSGAVGIEAISRGAARVVFVERYARVAAVLAENVAVCGFDPAASIVRAPWRTAARRLGGRGLRFDIAFFDPPYDRRDSHALLEDLTAGGLMADGGIAVVEHRTGAGPAAAADWQLQRQLAVGDTSFSFFGILTAP